MKKKIKFIYSLIFIIGIMFLSCINIKAFDETFTRKQITAPVTKGAWKMPVQATSNGQATLCTQIWNDNLTYAGDACRKDTSWSTQIKVGVAAIINKAKANLSATTMTDEYFAATLAINRFLYLHGGSSNNEVGASPNVTANVLTLFESYVSAAESAYDNYAALTLTVSPTQLTFTKQGTNYVSNEITVTTNGIINSPTTSIGTLNTLGGNKYSITVPESALSTGTNTITFEIGANKSVLVAQNYVCGSDGSLQSATPAVTELTSIGSFRRGASGRITIEEEKKPLTIYDVLKVDENGSPLAGASMQVLTSGGNIVDRWTTTTTAHRVTGITTAGTYILMEVSAPGGYVKNDDQIKLVVEEDGASATVRFQNSKEDKPLTIYDVLKVNENGNPLAGAKLVVTDKSFKIIDAWTTTTSVHRVTGLTEPGTYYLFEESAPEGYVKSSEIKEFVVTTDGGTKTIQFINTKEDEKELTVVNVEKIDSSTKQALAGATLQVQDSTGKVYDEWISTTTAHTVTKLLAGKYYLVEKSAPEGYVKNTEKKEFTVANDDKTITLTMDNKPNKVQITKIDASTKGQLKGAELQIEDEKGNIVRDAEGKQLKWTTDGKAYVINKLKVGTYYIVETKVPDGYVVSSKKKFTVSDSQELIEVTFENKPTRVEISKINMTDGQLLAGAKLQIQDKDGKVIYEWESDGKILVKEGLKYGTYYLVEISAPDGYELNTEKVQFEINKNSETVKVEMKNALLVEVPDTLSARSTLLLCIAMFDIALGIGIVTYVKKNKIKE